jgi:hypothetical protein
LLSNYNIKYICTIYTRLDTCIMSTSRLSLRDKVALRLLKLHFYGADVVEWSRALELWLSDWCCSVTMVWVQIPIEGRTNIWQLKNRILTLFGLIFRRIYINVWKSSQRMNLRDVGSETSVNDSVQTNKMINKRLKCSTTTPKKDVKI